MEAEGNNVGYKHLHHQDNEHLIPMEQTNRFINQPVHQQLQNPCVVVQPPGPTYTTTTTVITQQPQEKNPWHSGMCDCCEELSSCCCVWWCGNAYLGSMASRMGENCCVGCCLPGLWPMRSAFRERHNIPGDICNDCCVTTFCGPCTACQLAREMNTLGYPKNCC